MVLFWHKTGPLMKYEDGILHIEDLNPEMKMRWCMSRKEMFQLGWKYICAAIIES